MREPTNKTPQAVAAAEGAQDTTSSPYSIASIVAAEASGASAFNIHLPPAKMSWRDGLAQGSPPARHYEHMTFENGRAARRKLARMLAKKWVKP